MYSGDFVNARDGISFLIELRKITFLRLGF